MRTVEFRLAFTEYIPPDPEPDVLYVSLKYATAVHLCACGCGLKVVTPFSPVGWRLTFDGSVSIQPSIGNWQYPCQSHYFIRSNKVIWATPLTPGRIEASKQRDRNDYRKYYGPPATRKHTFAWLGRPWRRRRDTRRPDTRARNS
jgi:Family of unknown function (DUF6527)